MASLENKRHLRLTLIKQHSRDRSIARKVRGSTDPRVRSPSDFLKGRCSKGPETHIIHIIGIRKDCKSQYHTKHSVPLDWLHRKKRDSKKSLVRQNPTIEELRSLTRARGYFGYHRTRISSNKAAIQILTQNNMTVQIESVSVIIAQVGNV